MEDLKFIGDLVGNQNLGEFDIIDILDPQMFFLSLEDEDLEEIYFWSKVTFDIFVFDIKKLGVIEVNGEAYTLDTFPVMEIHKTHLLFEETLSEERLNNAKENIDRFQKELVKLTIDKTSSN